MAPATYDDATLMMQLLAWGTQSGSLDASERVWDDGFDAETVPENNEDVRRTLYFHEVLGTFVKQGILNADLVYDMWMIKPTWDHLAPVVKRMRASMGIDRLWENFESLAAKAP